MARKMKLEECELNMTPMIDVVFQLIIFFVVTLRMDEEVNKEIILEKAPHAPAVTKDQRSTMVIEVDKRGHLSMHGYRITRDMLRGMLRRRFAKTGEFPVMIRADNKTPHQHVRAVMDMCTESGLWRINFAAIKETRM